MARERKVTTFENLHKNQCFQIVGGTTDLIWQKRNRFTARATTDGGLWHKGSIIDVRKDQEVTRCLSLEQRAKRVKQVA